MIIKYVSNLLDQKNEFVVNAMMTVAPYRNVVLQNAEFTVLYLILNTGGVLHEILALVLLWKEAASLRASTYITK